MYKLVTLLKDKERDQMWEMAEEQRWILTMILIWSWSCTPGELWIVLPWKADCIDGPVNGLSGSYFYTVIPQLLPSRGWVCFSTAWIWAVLWFALAKKKRKTSRSNIVPRPQEVHLLPLFLGNLPFHENKPSSPCWRMRPVTSCSPPHPTLSYSWPAGMSVKTS